MSSSRGVAVVVALALAAVVAWRVIAAGLADHYAQASPQQALAWQAHQPTAALRRARSELRDHKPAAAAATARELLQQEPLTGPAFGILAESAEQSGDEKQAAALYAIAVRRDPRDTYAQSWLIQSLLRNGKLTEAIAQFDTLYRVSPAQGSKFLPLFAQWCEANEFADAVTARLVNDPPWKAGMLAALLERDGHDATSRVFGTMQQAGRLSLQETGQWLDRLMQDGYWGEAYGRWVGTLHVPPQGFVPPLYNGAFESEPSGIGFDWRIVPTAGVLVERAIISEDDGNYGLDLVFSGRRVPDINVEQRLFLAPGSYALHFRARAESLRSDKGLQWTIQCYGAAEALSVSPPLGGSFDWKAFDATFDVPPDCAAQRLWLRNPGADAAGKEVSGSIWFSDFAIAARAPASAAAAAAGKH